MKTKLSVVSVTGTKPSRTLGNHGAALWRSVVSEYHIDDAGGIELLTAACQQLDRAESLREQIDVDGYIVRTKDSLREHPGLRHELAARAFVVPHACAVGP